MIKLLIVEDEETIRDGIVHMLNWESYQIEISGAVANGKEALEKFQCCPPDLLLTDIRMPKMDGLELIKQAKQYSQSFLPIILSGYNDFNYARQGLVLGVTDYILKPCRPEELLQAILAAKQQWEEQQQHNRTVQHLQSTWSKNRALAKQQKLTQWMEQRKEGLEDRQRTLEELEMKLLPGNLQVGAIHIEQKSQRHHYKAEDWDMLRFAALNIVQETLSELYKGQLECFVYQEQLIWCANVHSGITPDIQLHYLQQLQSNIRSYLNLSISIGLGDEAGSIERMHESFAQALKMLETCFFNGTGSILIYRSAGQANALSGDSLLVNEQLHRLEDEMIDSLNTSQYAKTLDVLEQWHEQLRVLRGSDKLDIHLKVTSFIIELQKLATKQLNSSFEWKTQVIDWVEQLPQIETFDELTIIVKKIVQQLIESLAGRTMLHRTVQAAIDIIQERYTANLSLDQVAKEVFVSNTYLSTLFKQELGINFLDYLHQYRIEKSKPLLMDGLKVFAVAKMVGYQDERHYSHTFKKWTGVTPSHYQKNKLLH